MHKLDNVVFLAADTIRSRAYAQALENAGIKIKACLIVKSREKKWGQSDKINPGNTNYGSLFVPDMNLPLDPVCKKISDQIDTLETGSINAPEVEEWLKNQNPDYVIFSGFGGELVKPHILNAAGPLIHMHAGYLPDYRGSTTIYYSYINEKNAGVSAIYLKEEIDTGPIIDRKLYAAPPNGGNIDYYYDSVMRADLLVQVIEYYIKNGKMNFIGEQSENEGAIYYIIHPLLKHLALNDIHKKQITFQS